MKDCNNIGCPSKYLADLTPQEKLRYREETLNRAHDIRKFEIELYWKRATYFWAFLVSIFAGFLQYLNQETGKMIMN